MLPVVDARLLNGFLSVLVEDHVDLHTVVGKERGTDDVVVLFGKLTKGTCSVRLGYLYDSHAVDDYNSWIWGCCNSLNVNGFLQKRA